MKWMRTGGPPNQRKLTLFDGFFLTNNKSNVRLEMGPCNGRPKKRRIHGIWGGIFRETHSVNKGPLDLS